MSRRLPVLVGLAVLAATLGAAPAVIPTQATGCATAESVDFRYDDGRWLVLRAGGCTEGLHVYDQGWHHNSSLDVQYRVNATYGSPDFHAFVRASDGGWWFVGSRGRAYRFSSELKYENRTTSLPIEWREYPTGVAIDEAGRWWIATNSETRVYDPDRNETVQTFQQGAADIRVRDGRVWRLSDGRKGGLVHEYVVREDGGRLTLHERATHELGPEVFNPVLLSRGPDGKWWVYSNHRNAFAYTEDWQYTGERAPPDSGLQGVFMLALPLSLGFTGLIIVMGNAMVNQFGLRLLVQYAGTFAFAAVFAVELRQSLLPAQLLALYRFPDDAVAAVLVAWVVGQTLLLEERSADRILLVAVANAPLLVVAWDFATSVG